MGGRTGCVMNGEAALDMLPGFDVDVNWRYVCATDSQTTYLYKGVMREEAGTGADGTKIWYTDVWVRNVAPDGTYRIDEVRIYSDRRYAFSKAIEFDANGNAGFIIDIEHPEEDAKPITENTMPELLYYEAYETTAWREYQKKH